MANPPKPTEVKRRLGNPGRRPLPTLGSLAVVPSAELSLIDEDLETALTRVMEYGVVWLANTDIKLVLLKEAIADYQRVTSSGSPSDRRKCREEIRLLMSDLGFDPTARSRLGLAEVKAANVLDRLLDSRRTGDPVHGGNLPAHEG